VLGGVVVARHLPSANALGNALARWRGSPYFPLKAGMRGNPTNKKSRTQKGCVRFLGAGGASRPGGWGSRQGTKVAGAVWRWWGPTDRRISQARKRGGIRRAGGQISKTRAARPLRGWGPPVASARGERQAWGGRYLSCAEHGGIPGGLYRFPAFRESVQPTITPSHAKEGVSAGAGEFYQLSLGW